MRSEAALSKVVDGATQREHLQRAAERGSRSAIKALEESPDCPDELEYLWEYFIELSLGRASGPMGATSLSYQDVMAWMTLMDRKLAPYEVSALLEIDAAWRNPVKEEKE